MAATQAKSRYMAALRDQPSPTEKGRAKVMKQPASLPPPDPPAPKSPPQRKQPSKSRIASKWQAAAQQNFKINTTMGEQKEVPKPFAVTSPPPPPPPSRRVNNYELAQQRRQRDADKDIPRGKVSNSPFRPTPEPPPPQLRQQKQQWDAKRDIPRGTVQGIQMRDSKGPQNKESLEAVGSQKKIQWDAARDIPKGAVKDKNQDDDWSPRSGNSRAPPPSPEGGRTKPKSPKLHTSPRLLGSPDTDPDVEDVESPSCQLDAENDIPRGQLDAVNDIPRGQLDAENDIPRGQLDAENDIPRGQLDADNDIPRGNVSKIQTNRIFFAESPEVEQRPQLVQQKKQWDAHKDIPRGKVKGMSNLFAGGKVETQISANLMDPLDTPGPSPADISYQPEIIKPIPIAASLSEDELPPAPTAASLSEDELSPTHQHSNPEGQQAGSFYMDNDDRGETDPWMVPLSAPSDPFFGQGSWGEAVDPSLSNDEYDDRDWFQSGSFGNEEEKKDTEFGSFPNDQFANPNPSAFPAPKRRQADLEDSHHDDGPVPSADSGSFAAAIQPVTVRRLNAKPETVTEDPDAEEEAAAYEAAADGSAKENSTLDENVTNSEKLQSMLVSGGEQNLPSDARSTTSKGSKTSKGSRLGFLKKSEKVNPDDSPEKKRRGGIFKMFSRKEQSNNDDAPPSPRVTPSSKGRGMKPPTFAKGRSSRNSSPMKTEVTDASSLKDLTKDVEKERSKGVISTRDDMTVVSEMTNPTVFLKQEVPSIEEKVEAANDKVAAMPGQRPPIVDDTLTRRVETMRIETFSSVTDPFDLHSPLFSNGDPFGSSKQFDSLQVSANNAFSDPFFATLEKDVQSASFASELVEVDGEQVASSEEMTIEDDTKNTGSSKPLAIEATSDESSIALDAPDPEIELLSSDDDAENDDPATESDNTSRMVPTKHPILESSMKHVRRVGNPTSIPQKLKPELNDAPLDEISGALKEEALSRAAPIQSDKANAPRTRPVRRANRPKAQRPSGQLEPSAVALDEVDGAMKRIDAPVASIPQVKPSAHTRESADSTESVSKLLQNTAGSNLTYKMRVKRYEKKMQRTKAMQELEQPVSLPQPQPSEHVSTSAYLTRFKSKGMNKTKTNSSKGTSKVTAAARSESSQSTVPTAPKFDDRAPSFLGSAESDRDAFPSIEATDSHASTGSRSARRTMRAKGKGTHSPVPPAKAKPFVPNSSGAAFVSQSPAPVAPSTGRLATASLVATRSALQQQAKPRSILKKPKRGIPAHERIPRPSSPYNEKKINDPMHRAGLRLLAAAVIPIQAEMRRFLAKREALNKMWAIIVIEAAARRWLVMRQVDREDEAALIIQTAFADHLTREYARVLIQAHVRRWLVQKEMLEAFAVVLIQAQFRRWIVQTEYREHKAVIRLQTNVRGWLIIKEYRLVIAATRIQCWARSCTARNTYKKLRSAVRIQSCVRGWIAYKNFWQHVLAAIQIQAVFRGWLVHDYIEDQQYCATQIQRIFRGYRATMTVYEDIYKVTLLQSYMRMKIAVERTSNKLAFVIQMQSIMRGYLVRKRLETMISKAIVMQRHWRGHSSRLNYQFDILDIILVQSVYRRSVAMKELAQLKHAREIRCATIIQTQWRSYDCTMNYLHYLADVLILQSAVRRWSASRHVKSRRHDRQFRSATLIQACARSFLVRNRTKRNRAAFTIQKSWRGFVSYAEYMFTIADIVIAQTQARCWVARRKRKVLSDKRDMRAASKIQTLWRRCAARTAKHQKLQKIVICQSVVRRIIAQTRLRQDLLEKYCAETIQRLWIAYGIRQDEKAAVISIQRVARGLSQRKKYTVAIQESRASMRIQAAWRRFWLFSNFIITLDSAIIVQSVARSYIVRADIRHKTSTATLIQAKVRSINARRTASAKSMSKALFSACVAVEGREVDAALVIQMAVRGSNGRHALSLHRNARVIQARWRSVGPRRTLQQHCASVRVQMWWRRLTCFIAYTRYRSAKKIQTHWRASVARAQYKQYIGARKLQTAWRMIVAQSAYKRRQGAKEIQTAWRGCIARKKYVQYLVTAEAATMIQSAWRAFICYTDYIFTLADVVTVQRRARGYIHRKIYATKCEERDRQITEERRKRELQITEERRKRELRTAEEHRQRELQIAEDRQRERGATEIQRVYRGSRGRLERIRLLSAVNIQRVIRGYLSRLEVDLIKQYLEERRSRNDAALTIQTLWRGYDQKQKFWYLLGCAIQVQCLARGVAARLRYVDAIGSIIVAQSVTRRWVAIRNFKQMRLIASLLSAAKHEESEKHQAAKTLQRWYFGLTESRRRTAAAIKVQCFFRMVKAMVDREIVAEKKRRKRRKKLKNRTEAVDEAMLEDAWDYVSLTGDGSKDFQQAQAAVADVLGRSRSVPRQGRQDDSSDRNLVLSRSRDSIRSENLDAAAAKALKKNLLPPSYYAEESQDFERPPADTVRMKKNIDDSDAMSEVSGMTAPSVYRAPPSRLEHMGDKELAIDLSLEEAWVDMEIQNVKQKRRTTAKGKKHRSGSGGSSSRSHYM
jgi:hypothetical protein